MMHLSKTLLRALRLALYVLLPLLTAITPLLVLPVITREYGEGGWAAVAIGQSVGTVGSLVVNLGWSVIGPSQVHACPPDLQAALYEQSLRTRYFMLLATVPASMGIAAALAPNWGWAAALTSLAFVLYGAGSGWYYIALGRPVGVLLHDAGPRVAAAVVAIIAVPIVGLVALPILQIILFAIGSLSSNLRVLGRVLPQPAPIWRTIVDRGPLVVSGVISSGYVGFSVALVALVAPPAVPLFAAAARFRDFGVSALAAVSNFFTGLIGRQGDRATDRWRIRVRSAFGVGILGALGGVLIATAAPTAGRLLFHGAVSIGYDTASLTGGIVLLIAVGLAVGTYLLVPAGLQGEIVKAGIVATAVGTPTLLILSNSCGATGGLLAVLLAEFLSAGLQLSAWLQHLRKHRDWRTAELGRW